MLIKTTTPENLSVKDKLVRKGILAGGAAHTGPYGMQVGITDYCNYRCVFCASFSYRKEEPNEPEKKFITLDSARFSELVADAAELMVEQISIVGVGEPFLHPDIMPFIEQVKRRSIKCMVTTNGSTLDKKRVDLIIESGLDILNVSINAASKETYAVMHGEEFEKQFDPIINAISYLTKRKKESGNENPRLVLRFILTSLNVAEIDSFVDMAIEVGANEIFFQNYAPPTFAGDITLDREEKINLAKTLTRLKVKTGRHEIKSNIDFIVARYESAFATDGAPDTGYMVNDDFYTVNPCYTGWTYVMILATGAVMPCCYCGIPLGDINKKSFKEIWFDEKYNAFRKNALDLPKSGKNIEGCRCFDNCGSISDNIRVMERFRFR